MSFRSFSVSQGKNAWPIPRTVVRMAKRWCG